MPIAPSLQRFVDDELGRSATFAARVVAGTLQLLREARDQPLSAGERADCIALLIELQRQGERYERSFISALQTRVDEALKSAPGQVADLVGGGPAGELTLMDESLVDTDIEISRAMQLIDTTADWELRELQTFTSTLVGEDHVNPESNPFRPLVYATVLWDAACAIVSAPAQRALLLRHTAGVSAGLLKNAWAAACSRLEAQGVEPGTYRTVVLPGGGAVRGATVDVSRPGALGGLLAKMPSTSGTEQFGDLLSDRAWSTGRPLAANAGVPWPGPPADPERASRFEAALLRLDAELRTAASHAGAPAADKLTAAVGLGSRRTELVAHAGSSTEQRVIELLSRIFDTVLSDPALAVCFRHVIARLQVAALRVALHDPALMESNRHPVWRLIDRIGELSLALAPEDPRLVTLQSACQEVADDIASAALPDAALFQRGLVRIDHALNQQAEADLREAGSRIEALRLAERRALLEHRWTERLAAQIAGVRTTPAMRRFVTGVWARVLADAEMRPNAPEAGAAALRTLEDLLWSLQIPDHPQSRQRLITLLPVLLGRLRAAMQAINLPPHEQQGVLDELMAIHADALRPGARTTPSADPLAAAEIVRRMRDEVVSPTLRRSRQSDSVIDLETMDTVPAAEMATPGDAVAAPAPGIDDLRAFERRRLFLHGRWSRCQLLWRSDAAQYFLFSGETAGSTHAITRIALDRLNAAGLSLPMQSKPLLQRAVDHLVRETSRR